VHEIPKKTKVVSSLIPGNLSTYIYDNETDYYNEYRQSMFAITTKKGGWDCMRHYEILANGCIPYFPNIEDCPENTMVFLPKELLEEGNRLFEKLHRKKINELSEEDQNQYMELIQRLLHHTREYLTTTKMAEYVLNKSNNTNAKSILFLSGDNLDPDYLRCLLLNGFKTVFGKKCHDFPKIRHLYKDETTIDYQKLYGKGISYSNILEQDLHDDDLDSTVEKDIETHKYDIIIYGSCHRGMPYYSMIEKYYQPDEVILLCGEDQDSYKLNNRYYSKDVHDCEYGCYADRGHSVFIRELM